MSDFLVGRHGEGYARSQMPTALGDKTIIAASLGKGFGASGGMLMLGSEEQEALFRRYSQPYVFSAAPNLAAVGAALASAEIHAGPELGRRQALLAETILRFDSRIPTKQAGTPLPIRMIAIGKEEDAIALTRPLSRRLHEHQVKFGLDDRG